MNSGKLNAAQIKSVHSALGNLGGLHNDEMSQDAMAASGLPPAASSPRSYPTPSEPASHPVQDFFKHLLGPHVNEAPPTGPAAVQTGEQAARNIEGTTSMGGYVPTAGGPFNSVMPGVARMLGGAMGFPQAANRNERYQAATEAIKGAGEAVNPAMLVAGAGSLPGLARGFGGSTALAKGSAALTKAAGGSQQAQEFAGEAGGWLPILAAAFHGTKAAKAPEVAPEVSTPIAKPPTEAPQPVNPPVGESDMEAARRGAPAPITGTAENRVPVEQRASTLIPQEQEAQLAQRIAARATPQTTPPPAAPPEPPARQVPPRVEAQPVQAPQAQAIKRPLTPAELQAEPSIEQLQAARSKAALKGDTAAVDALDGIINSLPQSTQAKVAPSKASETPSSAVTPTSVTRVTKGSVTPPPNTEAPTLPAREQYEADRLEYAKLQNELRIGKQRELTGDTDKRGALNPQEIQWRQERLPFLERRMEQSATRLISEMTPEQAQKAHDNLREKESSFRQQADNLDKLVKNDQISTALRIALRSEKLSKAQREGIHDVLGDRYDTQAPPKISQLKFAKSKDAAARVAQAHQYIATELGKIGVTPELIDRFAPDFQDPKKANDVAKSLEAILPPGTDTRMVSAQMQILATKRPVVLTYPRYKGIAANRVPEMDLRTVRSVVAAIQGDKGKGVKQLIQFSPEQAEQYKNLLTSDPNAALEMKKQAVREQFTSLRDKALSSANEASVRADQISRAHGIDAKANQKTLEDLVGKRIRLSEKDATGKYVLDDRRLRSLADSTSLLGKAVGVEKVTAAKNKILAEVTRRAEERRDAETARMEAIKNAVNPATPPPPDRLALPAAPEAKAAAPKPSRAEFVNSVLTSLRNGNDLTAAQLKRLPRIAGLSRDKQIASLENYQLHLMQKEQAAPVSAVEATPAKRSPVAEKIADLMLSLREKGHDFEDYKSQVSRWFKERTDLKESDKGPFVLKVLSAYKDALDKGDVPMEAAYKAAREGAPPLSTWRAEGDQELISPEQKSVAEAEKIFNTPDYKGMAIAAIQDITNPSLPVYKKALQRIRDVENYGIEGAVGKGHSSSDVQKAFALLQQIEQSPPENLGTLYRGLNTSKKFTPGQEISLPFSSFSLDPDTAKIHGDTQLQLEGDVQAIKAYEHSPLPDEREVFTKGKFQVISTDGGVTTLRQLSPFRSQDLQLKAPDYKGMVENIPNMEFRGHEPESGLVYLHDKQTGSTLAMQASEVTPDALKQHVEASRNKFENAADKKSLSPEALEAFTDANKLAENLPVDGHNLIINALKKLGGNDVGRDRKAFLYKRAVEIYSTGLTSQDPMGLHDALKSIRDGARGTQLNSGLAGIMLGKVDQDPSSTSRLDAIEADRADKMKGNGLLQALDTIKRLPHTFYTTFFEKYSGIQGLVKRAEAQGTRVNPERNPYYWVNLVKPGIVGATQAINSEYNEILSSAYKEGLYDSTRRVMELRGYKRALNMLEQKRVNAQRDAQLADLQMSALSMQIRRGQVTPRTGSVQMGMLRKQRAAALRDFREFNSSKAKNEQVPAGYGAASVSADLISMENQLGPDKWKKANDYADKIFARHRNALDQYHAAGMLSTQKYNELTGLGDDHVALQRFLDKNETSDARNKNPYYLWQQQVIKDLRGSARTTRDPFITTISSDYRVANNIWRNEAAKATIELGQRAFPYNPASGLKPGPSEFYRVTDKTPLQESTHRLVPQIVNGGMDHWAVPREIADNLAGLDPKDTALLTKILQRVGLGFRASATRLNLAFALPNAIRHVAAYHVLADNAPGWRLTRWPEYFGHLLDATKEIASSDPAWREFQRSGGAFSSMTGAMRPETMVGNIQNTNTLGHRFVRLPGRAAEAMERATNIVEDMTKFTAFKQNRAAGQGPIEAAFNARNEGAPDFSRGGLWKPGMNVYWMFSGAHLSYLTQAARAIDPRTPAGMRKFALLATSMVGLEMARHKWNAQFKDDDGKPESDHWSPEDQAQNWIMARPDVYETSDGSIRHRVFKVPKVVALRLFSNPVSSVLDTVQDDKPLNAEQIALDFASQLMPGQYKLKQGSAAKDLTTGTLASANPVLREPLEQAENIDFWSRTPIVPRHQQELPVEMQTNPFVSKTAAEVAGAASLSPTRVQHAIRGVTGGLGETVMHTADYLQGQVKQSPMALKGDEALAKNSVYGQFIRRFVGTGQDEIKRQLSQSFYDSATQVRMYYEGQKNLERTNPDAVSDYTTAHQMQIAAYPWVNKMEQQLASLRRMKQMTVEDKSMVDEDKFKQLRSLNGAEMQLLQTFDRFVKPMIEQK